MTVAEKKISTCNYNTTRERWTPEEMSHLTSPDYLLYANTNFKFKRSENSAFEIVAISLSCNLKLECSIASNANNVL